MSESDSVEEDCTRNQKAGSNVAPNSAYHGRSGDSSRRPATVEAMGFCTFAAVDATTKQVTKVNAEITKMKQDGTLAKIHEQWFGAKAEPNSTTVKVMEMPKL